METTVFDDDIKVFYIPATSFPEGIMEAFNKMYALVPFSAERKFFGVSRPENGVIHYKAAAEELTAGEAEKLDCNTIILKKGTYISLTINNYTDDIQSIDRAFKELLSHSGLDPQGYCVEWYFNETDVKCMIRLKQ
jgi:hypothetical protein